ncbi:glutathione S-transferase family protein [Actibacterium sp.]|uniref:glutathione S-transferase family protein n=1 Tax=Actibacterium sp. TaxID=1872125 RepID=UPI003564EB70
MIHLHHVPMARSLRVMWMLEELGLDYDLSLYSIRDGSMRTPEFLRLSPAGRTPVLEMGDEVIFESGAILQLLAERHPQSGLHRAPDHPDRARYLELIHYSETIGCLVENLNMNRVFLRNPADASPVVIRLLTARLRGALAAVGPQLRGDFLLDSGFSAADIMLAYGFVLADRYVRVGDYPELQAYWDRCKARPAYQRAAARDGVQDFFDRDFYPLPEV